MRFHVKDSKGRLFGFCASLHQDKDVQRGVVGKIVRSTGFPQSTRPELGVRCTGALTAAWLPRRLRRLAHAHSSNHGPCLTRDTKAEALIPQEAIKCLI